MQIPLAPHSTSFASLNKCVELYVKILICSSITDNDSRKCLYCCSDATIFIYN